MFNNKQITKSNAINAAQPLGFLHPHTHIKLFTKKQTTESTPKINPEIFGSDSDPPPEID